MNNLARVENRQTTIYDNLGSYRQDIETFEKMYGRNYEFENIKEFVLQSQKAETRNKRVKAFKKYYSNNIKDKHLLDVKLEEINTLRVKQQLQEIELEINKKQFWQVIDKLNKTKLVKPEKAKYFDELKYKKIAIILETIYCTGLRINELVSIHRDNIKLNGVCKIQIIGKGSIAETIEIPLELYHRIISLFGSKSEYLFCTNRGSNYKQPNLFKEVRDIFYKFLGIEIGLHTFRHLYATELVKAGVDIHTVSKLMRHKNINTTSKYYLHIKPKNKDIISKLR